MKVNYAILSNSMVLNFDGQTLTLNKSDLRYNTIIEAIKSDNLDAIPELLDNTSVFKQFKGVTVVDGELYYDGLKMPHGLSQKIFDFAEQQLPFEPLIKFFKKLSTNPSFNSRKMLYSFLEHNGHPITNDGNFIAYRGVTDDFKDCHTRTFDNSVGAVCEMPRSEVDENPNNTCSNGLHVACFEYANSFGSQTIEIEVNPADVVAVPTDYNGTKMRCCKFKVVAISKNERAELLYNDDYNEDFDYEFQLDSFVNVDGVNGVFEIVGINDDFTYELMDNNGNCFTVYESNLIEIY